LTRLVFIVTGKGRSPTLGGYICCLWNLTRCSSLFNDSSPNCSPRRIPVTDHNVMPLVTTMPEFLETGCVC